MKKSKLIAGGILFATSMMTVVSVHSVNSAKKDIIPMETEEFKVVKLVNEVNLLQSANDTEEESNENNIQAETTSVEVTEEKIVIEEKTIDTEETTAKAKKEKKANQTKKKKNKKKEAYTYVGEFKVTAYCGCSACCGKSNGITASGTHATAGRTIAADTSRFPFGTKLKIGDQIYTVEDRGGAISGNRIDVYFNSHSAALQWGVRYCDVYVKNV